MSTDAHQIDELFRELSSEKFWETLQGHQTQENIYLKKAKYYHGPKRTKKLWRDDLARALITARDRRHGHGGCNLPVAEAERRAKKQRDKARLERDAIGKMQLTYGLLKVELKTAKPALAGRLPLWGGEILLPPEVVLRMVTILTCWSGASWRKAMEPAILWTNFVSGESGCGGRSIIKHRAN